MNRINPLYKLLILPFKFIISYKNSLNYFLYKLTKNKGEFIFFLKNGLKIKARGNTNDFSIINELCVCKVYSYKQLQLSKDMNIIIDIGAHIGTFSILTASKYHNYCLIYSYEPEPNNFNLLKENIMTNHLYNIKIFQEAVYKQAGEANLYLSNSNLGYHNIFRPTSNSITVKTTTLENIFITNNIDKCDLLKLDCEGSEYDILTTASDHILNKIKFIIAEIHENLGGYKIEQLVNFFNNKQFEVVEIRKFRGVDNTVLAKNKFFK